MCAPRSVTLHRRYRPCLSKLELFMQACRRPLQPKKCRQNKTAAQPLRKKEEAHPTRWSGPTRDWSPIGAVTLNPERDAVIAAAAGEADKRPLAA